MPDVIHLKEPEIGFSGEDRKSLYKAEFDIESIKNSIFEIKNSVKELTIEKADKDQLSTDLIKELDRRVRSLENQRWFIMGGFAVIEVILRVMKF